MSRNYTSNYWMQPPAESDRDHQEDPNIPSSSSSNLELLEDLTIDDFLHQEEDNYPYNHALPFTTNNLLINPHNLHHQAPPPGGSPPRISREEGGEQVVRDERFAFRTRSDVDILDDGFKWRKYGKKMVKNSPNPRNYYKCSVNGCVCKKRVERDGDDPDYVITTYHGYHTH